MNDRRSQSGFILVATIWLTLIVFVLAGLFSFYANQQLDKAVISKQRAKEQLDSFSLENTLLYTFSTNSVNRAGLLLDGGENTLRLDGTVYRGVGDLLFSVNDYAGLVGLNSANSKHLEELLKVYETDGLKRAALLAALADYIDQDDRPRLAGREAAAYRVASMPGPSNEYLKSTRELYRVYGWREWLLAHPDFDVDTWLSTNWRSRLNVNTASEVLVEKVLPLSESEKSKFLQRRRQNPYRNIGDLNEVTNLRTELDEDFYTFFPIHEVRFRILSENNRKISTFVVFFNPMSVSAPWEIDHRYQIENSRGSRESSWALASEYFDR